MNTLISAAKALLTREGLSRVARWGTIGLITAALDVGLFTALYAVVGSVLISNAVVMPITTTFNYLSHHKWSFRSDAQHTTSTIRYAVALVIGYVLNSSLVYVALYWIGLTPSLSKIAAIVVQAPISFLLMNFWIFTRSSPVVAAGPQSS